MECAKTCRTPNCACALPQIIPYYSKFLITLVARCPRFVSMAGSQLTSMGGSTNGRNMFGALYTPDQLPLIGRTELGLAAARGDLQEVER